ncbi:MAG: hypothetical protein OXD50_07390 [Chloroflexi bacterium]|nr:hypothetical protein [Chloroflexota bacterium]
MAQISLPEGRTVDRMTLVKALIRGKFDEDAAEETANVVTTMVTESTQGHATNEALAGVESRLAALIAQSEARQMRWMMTVGAFVIAAITIIDKVL